MQKIRFLIIILEVWWRWDFFMFCTSVLCWFSVWRVSPPSWWSSFSLPYLSNGSSSL